MMKLLRRLITHGMALVLGVALGIYLLPILIAPPAPTVEELRSSENQVIYRARFIKELESSDLFHWGEGEVSISRQNINFIGSLAPGPDYQLYLTENLVETESAFLEIKNESLKLGPVKTFENFTLPITGAVELEKYTAIVIWCESFGAFITAARYR